MLGFLDDINWQKWALWGGIALGIAAVIGGLLLAIHLKDNKIVTQATQNGQLTVTTAVNADTATKGASAAQVTNDVTGNAAVKNQQTATTTAQISTSGATQITAIQQKYVNNPVLTQKAQTLDQLQQQQALQAEEDKAVSTVNNSLLWQSYCQANPTNSKCTAYLNADGSPRDPNTAPAVPASGAVAN